MHLNYWAGGAVFCMQSCTNPIFLYNFAVSSGIKKQQSFRDDRSRTPNRSAMNSITAKA
jgi:hypothetical protein